MGERRGTKALEMWCRRVTEGYPGVRVDNMTSSWRDGLAFCALIHHFRPDLIDFSSLDQQNVYHNNELAFRTAERHLGIPALLDAEDMVAYAVPDRLSILTYLSQFYQVFGCSSPSSKILPDSPTTPTSPSKYAGVDVAPKPTSPSPAPGPHLPGLPPSGGTSCALCARKVYLAQRFVFNGRLFHRTCFRCARCQSQLTYINAYETHTGQFCCEVCPDEEEKRSLDLDRTQDLAHSSRTGDHVDNALSGHSEEEEQQLQSQLKRDKTTNILVDKKTSKHCDNMEHVSVEPDDLNILNKCTTDDDKVNSVQNSIRFFDKPSPTKLDNDKQHVAKTVWNEHIDNDDGKRWSYQKAIEMKYNKQNNKDNKQLNKEDLSGNKQSIILDKINKLKENQDKASKVDSKSRLRQPTKLNRNFSNDETTSNFNFSLNYKSPYLENSDRRKSLNNIENTSNLAVDKKLAEKLDNNLISDCQKLSSGQQIIGNVNFKSNRLKEFEKVLISNQKKNISNKFENRNSKSFESADLLPDTKISLENGFNISKLNLNHEPSNLDKIADKAPDVVSEINIDSSKSLEKNSPSHGSVKNLTETSFLNISSTSLNKESEDIPNDSDEDKTKINRTIHDIETIAQQIDNLTFNVNNIVNKHTNSDHTKSDVDQVTIDPQSDVNTPDANNTMTNSCAIADKVTQNDEKLESQYTAIGKVLLDNADIVTAINQSHTEYHKLELKDLPLDGLEDEPIIEKGKSAMEKANLKLDLSSSDNIFVINNALGKTSELVSEKSSVPKDSHIHSSNIFKNSPNGSPLPDVVIGLVEQLDNNERRIEKQISYEHDIPVSGDKDVHFKEEIEKETRLTNELQEDMNKNEYTKEENTENLVAAVRQDDNYKNISNTTNIKDTTADSLNPFGDDSDVEEKDKDEKTEEPKDIKGSQTNIKDIEEYKNDPKEVPLIKGSSTKDIDYPEDLNPFGDDDDDTSLDVSKSSLEISRTSNSVAESTNPFGDDLEDDLDRSNPFFSDLEEEEKVELKKTPVPTPRKSTGLTTPEPARRPTRPPTSTPHPISAGGRSRGSMVSLVSTTSSASAARKKKAAPPPPPTSATPLGVHAANSTPPPVSPRTRKRPPLGPRTSTPAAPISRTSGGGTPSTPNNYVNFSVGAKGPFSPTPISRNTSTLSLNTSADQGNTTSENHQTSAEGSVGFTPHKSTYGQWRRKKGHAPPVPIPQRRTIAPMPIENVKQELADIEIKQQELERQGVKLEEQIRAKSTAASTPTGEQSKSISDSTGNLSTTGESANAVTGDSSNAWTGDSSNARTGDSSIAVTGDSLNTASAVSSNAVTGDSLNTATAVSSNAGTAVSSNAPAVSPHHTEELVLQLFELVNEKNALLRRQSELMYLRRGHQLEEEHAELEYQIRGLMMRPAANKTDADKEREESLIQRLVEVVERRNEIVETLERDRIKQLEEDRSVTSQINIFAQDDSSLEPAPSRLSTKDTADTASITSRKHRTLSRSIASKIMKTLPKAATLGKHKKSHSTAHSSLESTGDKSLTSKKDKSVSSSVDNSLNLTGNRSLTIKEGGSTKNIEDKLLTTGDRLLTSIGDKSLTTGDRSLTSVEDRSLTTGDRSLTSVEDRSLTTGDRSLTSIGDKSLTGDVSLTSAGQSSLTSMTKDSSDCASEDAVSISSVSPAKKSKTLGRKILSKIQKKM